MCGARRFGWPDKRIAGRQSGLLSGRVRRDISKRAGFTLIELLVVIAILVLLMAILLPTLQRVKMQAKAVVCQTNQKQWGLIFSAYTSENDGNFWPVRSHSSFWPFLSETSDYNDLLLCPAANRAPDSMEDWGTRGYTFSPWVVHIHNNDPSWIISSYSVNIWIFDHAEPSYGTVRVKRYEVWGTCDVKGAASVPVLLDSRTPNVSPLAPANANEPPEYENTVPYKGMGAYCMNRHDGGINSLFMDWSVRKVGLKELWTLKWYRSFDTANEWTRAGGVMPEDWPEWMRHFKDY